MQENRDSLALHYTTMECLLHYLCASDEDEDLPLDPTVFVQAHDALLNAVNGVFYLLLQVNSGAMKLVMAMHGVFLSSHFLKILNCIRLHSCM